jgi:hypothetical protein
LTDCGACVGCVDLSADPENCGRCGRSCNGATCQNGGQCAPEILTKTNLGPNIYSMATDARHVYMGAGNIIVRVVSTGGLLEQVATGSETAGITLQGGDVFWSGLFAPTIQSAPVDGGLVDTITSSMPTPFLNTVAADDQHVFVTCHSGDGYLARVDRTSHAVEVLHQNVPGTTYFGVALDDAHAYFTTNGEVIRVDKDGANQLKLANGGAPILDEAYVYFTGPSGASPPSSIRRVPKNGGDTASVIENQPNLLGYAVDAERLYFRTNDADEVVETNSDGTGGTLVLASKQHYDSTSGAPGFTIDAGYVYWVGPNNWLYRTPK